MRGLRDGLDAHRRCAKDAPVHNRQLVAHDQSGGALIQDVALQVDAGCNLGQMQMSVDQFEDGALGHVGGAHSLAGCERAIEAEMVNLVHELPRAALFHDFQSVSGAHLQAKTGEGAAKHQCFGRLGDVDETTDAIEPRTEATDIHASFAVDFAETQKADVQSAAVVEVELRRLVDDGFGIDGGTKRRLQAGNLPIVPASTVKVMSRMPSSRATAATLAGMPVPRLTTGL